MTWAMNNRTGHWHHSGSTLIGALISMLILSIGMGALFSMYINNTQNSAHSRHVTAALTYARARIETLRFDSGTNKLPLSGSEQLQDNNTLFQRSWLTRENSSQDTRHITVTMRWQDSSGEHQITLETMINTATATDLAFLEP